MTSSNGRGVRLGLRKESDFDDANPHRDAFTRTLEWTRDGNIVDLERETLVAAQPCKPEKEVCCPSRGRLMFGCGGRSRLKHSFELAVKEPNVLVSDRRALLGDIAHPFLLHARTEVGVAQLFSGEDVGSGQAAFTLAFACHHGLFGTADQRGPIGRMWRRRCGSVGPKRT